ncbi:MAG: glycosyltransferase family 2 protein [Prevotellaceae bacterium]|jgi:GT2 family glycosyltransferase|nr:glycosyltransferase family 2 protein [Prevotellaceae bacterium]
MKIFAIIATFNGRQWYDRCFGSLVSSNIKLNIVVVDNNSQDGSIDYIRQNFPEITIFPQNKNLGFGAANNIGIKYTLDNGADYVLLLNQDAYIEENTVENLLKIFTSNIGGFPLGGKPVGIVAPVQTDGSRKNLDYNFQKIYLNNDNTKNFIDDLYFNRLKDFYETKCVNAAAWLINRECIEKVGGFDTSLFYHYGEDWNYCQRVNYHGFKIVIAPKIAVCHDRAERKGKFTESFKNSWNEISYKLNYGNILLSENQIDNEFLRIKRQYKRNIIKLILKLQINKMFELKKKFSTEINLLKTIKESIKINKKGGKIWL